MIEEYIDILINSLVFKGLPADEVQFLLRGKPYQIKQYKKGDVISQAGDECNYARVVLKGNLSGEMMDLNGKVLKIEDLNPSSMIAPAFLYGNSNIFPVNVISSGESLIWQMHRNYFSSLLQGDERLLNNYLNSIANRAQFLTEKIRFLSFPSLRSKIAGFLLYHSKGNLEFTLPITHQKMSELFGVARPSLSREFSFLNKIGIITSDRDNIVINDPNKLKDLVYE